MLTEVAQGFQLKRANSGLFWSEITPGYGLFWTLVFFQIDCVSFHTIAWLLEPDMDPRHVRLADEMARQLITRLEAEA